LLSYNRLSRKPLLFKSFTGILVEEFDDIYDREIKKRYYSMRCIVYQKEKIGSELLWHSKKTFQTGY
jgi:hypothetical protein